MRLKPALTLFAAFLLGAAGLSAADQKAPATPNIVDETGTMSANKERMKEVQGDLDAFAEENHVRVFIQYHLKSPADAAPFMRALATKLGVANNGVVLVHFADSPAWQVWVGEDVIPRFVGKPGTAKELTEQGPLKEATAAYVDAAVTGAQKLYAMSGLPAPHSEDPTDPYWHVLLDYQTASLLDGLGGKFGTPQ